MVFEYHVAANIAKSKDVKNKKTTCSHTVPLSLVVSMAPCWHAHSLATSLWVSMEREVELNVFGNLILIHVETNNDTWMYLLSYWY